MISSSELHLFPYECPACRCKIPQFKDLFFQGIHILAEIECSCCDEIYLQTLPIGHAAQFSIAFCPNKPEKSRYNTEIAERLALPLIESYSALASQQSSICRKIFREFEEVIIVNALDDHFGDTLLKLFNTTRHLQQNPEKGIIVLLPAQLEWLLPDGIAEAWLVELPLKQLRYGVPGLNAWVKEQLKSFRQYALSKAVLSVKLKQEEYLPYLKTTSFPLKEFTKRKLQITFIWREDRLWLSKDWEKLLFQISIKYEMTFLKNILLRKQLNRFHTVVKSVQKIFPETVFAIAGFGGSYDFNWAENKIHAHVNEQQEKDWCSLYASSQLIIGVQGSSLLIPSLLSGGCISLMPNGKIAQQVISFVKNFTENSTPVMS